MIWIKIFPANILESADFIRLLNVAGKKLCAVKIDDEIFVVQSKCPHAGADLSQGFCKEKKLICPYHRYEYDLRTGRGAEGQNNYIETYPVEVRTDGVYVGIKEKWTFLKNLFRIE